jgi:NDP-sugar pyrophosphorylase family protein
MLSVSGLGLPQQTMSTTTNNIVILAAGISSRMKLPATASELVEPDLLRQADERAKAMIEVGSARRPFLDYLLWNCWTAGLKDVVLVIGRGDDVVKEYYGPRDRDNAFHGLSISYAYQEIPFGRTKPLGTADALLQGLKTREDWRGSKFIVCNSDNLYSVAALRLLIDCSDDAALIDYDRDGLEFTPTRIAQFGITRRNMNGFVEEVMEKPRVEELDSLRDHNGVLRVSMNIFLLSYDIVLPFLEACPLHPVRQEKELVKAVSMMAQTHPRAMRAIPLREHVPDLTYKDDIPAVKAYLDNHYPHLSW